MIEQTKAVVTVAEMARMLGLSRARLYQLTKAGVFPPPVYQVSNHRPIYVEGLQTLCLEVRRRNCGINGKPVLFYAKGHRLLGRVKPTRKAAAKPKVTSRYADLMEAFRSLGLVARPEQVEAAVKHLYPSGVDGVDQAEVIKTVFLYMKRQDRGDSVGR
jgi:hypothetical protein